MHNIISNIQSIYEALTHVKAIVYDISSKREEKIYFSSQIFTRVIFLNFFRIIFTKDSTINPSNPIASAYINLHCKNSDDAFVIARYLEEHEELKLIKSSGNSSSKKYRLFVQSKNFTEDINVIEIRILHKK